MEYESLIAGNQTVKCEKAVERQSVQSPEDITTRTKAEELRIKNIAIESSINAIALADLKGKVTYVNRSFLKMWGYQAKREVLGKPAVEFWQSGETAARVIEVLRNEGDWAGELTAERKDGSTFDVHLSATTVKDEAGEPVCMMASFVDITERRRAEEALLRSEELFRVLVENAFDGINICEFDPKTIKRRLIFCNDRYVEMSGYTRKELENADDLNQLVVQHHSKEELELQYDCIVKGEPFSGTASWRRPDGRENIYEWTALSLKKDDRFHIIGVDRDITERKRAEEALRESEERYRLHFETVSDVIFSIDGHGRVLSVSPSVKRVLGYAPDELVGKRFPELSILHSDCVGTALTDVLRVLSGEEIPSVEYRFIAKDGRTVFGEVSAAPLVRDGRIVAVSCVARDITERKQVEKALKESEEKYRTQFEEALDAIFIADADTGILIDCNRAALELVGRAKSELVGKHQRILHPPEEVAGEFTRTFRQHMREKEGQALEARVLTKSGEIRDVSIEANEFELNGKRMLQGAFRDITERKRAEDALRHSEERFRDLVETIGDWIWQVDAGGVYTYASPKVRDILGYEPEEVLGKTPFDLMAPEEARRVADVFGRIVAAQRPFAALENTNLHKDGHPVVLETSGVPFFDAAGTFRGYRGVDRDITERKRADEALRESEERFRVIFDNAIDGVLLTAWEDGKFHTGNRMICTLLGYSLEEIKNMGVADIHPAQDMPYVLEQFGKQMNQEITLAKDIPVKRKDGSVFYADINSTPITLGGTGYLMGIFRDVTERKTADMELERRAGKLAVLNAELERSNRDLEEFTYAVSHDLQAPLRKMHAFAEFLKEDAGEQLSPECQDHIRHIQEGANRMKMLTRHLLELAHVGRGAELEPLDSREIVQRALDTLSQRIRDTGAEVQVQEELPTVKADALQLERVFQNLLGNALKFVPEGRRPAVSISAGRNGKMATFSVADNGIGIEEQYLETVFGVFQRLNPGKAYKGSGVGLALCAKIIRRHGGQIWAESAVGKGTVFRFTLPLSDNVAG